MVITTSITQNYLAKAKVLLNSVKVHHPDAIFCLCLVEREDEVTVAEDLQEFDGVIYPEDLWGNDSDDTIFKYSVVEACTAVKGALMRELMRTYPEQREFVYLDPDTLVTSPMKELLQELKSSQIVLTPHLLDPEETKSAIFDNEVCALRHGVFNLGFLALSRGEDSEKFLKWWESRLNNYCFADYSSGLFTDQKWVDLAPGFFDIHILKHRGYNVAPWNISQRVVKGSDIDNLTAGGVPLRFFHFSGFDSGANLAVMKRYASEDSQLLFEFRDNYIRSLKEAGQERLEKVAWTYGRFKNGSKVSVFYRKAFRHRQWKDPFHSPNWILMLWIVACRRYSKIGYLARSIKMLARKVWI